MPSLSALLQSLGNGGAVRNARLVLEARQREDWLVAGLARRLEAQATPAATATAPTATAPTAAA